MAYMAAPLIWNYNVPEELVAIGDRNPQMLVNRFESGGLGLTIYNMKEFARSDHHLANMLIAAVECIANAYKRLNHKAENVIEDFRLCAEACEDLAARGPSHLRSRAENASALAWDVIEEYDDEEEERERLRDQMGSEYEESDEE
jgi:hypothetical protein